MIEKPATNEENTIQDQVMETSNEKVVAQTEDASAKNLFRKHPFWTRLQNLPMSKKNQLLLKTIFGNYWSTEGRN